MNIIDKPLTISRYTRPGKMRATTLAVIMHWTGAGANTAPVVWAWFESLKNQPPTDPELLEKWKAKYSSAHYIINHDGTILHCIPDAEIAYHAGSSQVDPASGKIYTDWARAKFGEYALHPTTLSPNQCTIGIEMCPVDATGHFSDATIDAAVELVADICRREALESMEDIGTHNLVCGYKDCPRLWVNQPELLDDFRRRVDEA